MKLFSVFLFIFSSNVSGEELAYHNKTKNYVLDYSAGALRFDSYSSRRLIPARACNKTLLKEFWDRAIKHAQKYPRLSKAPAKNKPHVRLGNEWRSLTPLVRSELFSMEQEVMILEAREKILCSRK